MFRIQKAITIQIYMFAKYTQNEFIGGICMLGIPELLKNYVHGSLHFVFSVFILLVYIYMCSPVGAKDKKRYHVYLSFIKKKGDDFLSYVEDKRMYSKKQ